MLAVGAWEANLVAEWREQEQEQEQERDDDTIIDLAISVALFPIVARSEKPGR